MAEGDVSVEQLEQRLRAGEWLPIGLASRVLGVGRTTAHRWLEAGRTPQGDRLRYRPTPSGYRLFHPEDLLAILEKYRAS